jgi:hypothetical protein
MRNQNQKFIFEFDDSENRNSFLKMVDKDIKKSKGKNPLAFSVHISLFLPCTSVQIPLLFF